MATADELRILANHCARESKGSDDHLVEDLVQFLNLAADELEQRTNELELVRSLLDGAITALIFGHPLPDIPDDYPNKTSCH